MKRIRLTTTQNPYFDSAWSLYQQAFPEAERRLLETQAMVMNHERFHCDVIILDSKVVGILFWWNFDQLRFVEHLATSPAQRGKGLGAQILNQFLAESDILVILEVEKPEEELQQRRINFYQRLRFQLNTHFHQQPPYQPGGEPLELLLMSYPSSLTEEAVRFFHKECQPIIHFNILMD